jgi:hypothetical protein
LNKKLIFFLVLLSVDSDTPRDLEIKLRSPSGTESVLSISHPFNNLNPVLYLLKESLSISGEIAPYGPELPRYMSEQSTFGTLAIAFPSKFFFYLCFI